MADTVGLAVDETVTVGVGVGVALGIVAPPGLHEAGAPNVGAGAGAAPDMAEPSGEITSDVASKVAERNPKTRRVRTQAPN